MLFTDLNNLPVSKNLIFQMAFGSVFGMSDFVTTTAAKKWI